MRRPRLVSSVVSFVCVTLLASPPSVKGAESTSSTVAVVAGFGTRTSLRVVGGDPAIRGQRPDVPAVAVIEFSAGAEVLLTVERVPGPDCPEEAAVTFRGEGPGRSPARSAPPGRLRSPVGPAAACARVALTFLLRAGAGTYNLPIRFVLSAP